MKFDDVPERFKGAACKAVVRGFESHRRLFDDTVNVRRNKVRI